MDELTDVALARVDLLRAVARFQLAGLGDETLCTARDAADRVSRAARNLALAVDRLPPRERPAGWWPLVSGRERAESPILRIQGLEECRQLSDTVREAFGLPLVPAAPPEERESSTPFRLPGPAPAACAPHRVTVRTVRMVSMLDDSGGFDEPRFDVEHTPQCDALPYGVVCWLDQQERDAGTDDWPTEPGVYAATGEAVEYSTAEGVEHDFHLDFTLESASPEPEEKESSSPAGTGSCFNDAEGQG